MDENKFKLKIFLWDQFIRPLKKLINRHTLQSCLIALVMINFISIKSRSFFWIALLIVFCISVIDAIQYWKSGEYISHYRKEKYPEYKKIIKEVKKKKELPNEEFIRIVDGEELSGMSTQAKEYDKREDEKVKISVEGEEKKGMSNIGYKIEKAEEDEQKI